ncbi:MAG: transglutaminase family protein [Acidimicrobiales bacterium]|nr:transglutaminase family protein [Acidimicrobiales bacterium]
MSRIEVRHVTGYRYPSAVVASYNEARMTPPTTPTQLAIDARITVSPGVRLSRYWDYWGSLTHAFDVHVPHDELVVSATALVEVAPPAVGVGAAITWADLAGEPVADRFFELVVTTPATAADDQLDDVAATVRAGAATPLDAVNDTIERVHEGLAYERGSTSVSTSATEAWRAGRGVCQDFAHVTLSLLRRLGIPSRYVSGYFHPEPEAGIGETVVGESHAWVEAWVGDWYAVDPTNAAPVGESHVLVARGREYGDVTPLKGVYTGAASSTPTVVVEVTRRA